MQTVQVTWSLGSISSEIKPHKSRRQCNIENGDCIHVQSAGPWLWIVGRGPRATAAGSQKVNSNKFARKDLLLKDNVKIYSLTTTCTVRMLTWTAFKPFYSMFILYEVVILVPKLFLKRLWSMLKNSIKRDYRKSICCTYTERHVGQY